MKHILGNDFNIDIDSGTVLTLGNFDGLHLGHRKLINTVKEYAEKLGLLSAVLSFYPHPVAALNRDVYFKMIFSPEERQYFLEQMGIDIFVECLFNKEFSQMEPEYFVEEILFKKLKCKVVVIGEGNRFGKNHRGSYEMLKELGEKSGVMVIAVPHEKYNDEKISSSNVRKLILEKKFNLIEKYLTVPYFIMGKVKHGRKIGRTLGFPTINLTPYQHKLLPPNGVYLTKTSFNGSQYCSITNIGCKPTFDSKTITIETYMFDFNEEIYGAEVIVSFYDFLRDETKFSSVENLKEQIESDIAVAKKYFNTHFDPM